jgi:hypothetical protein
MITGLQLKGYTGTTPGLSAAREVPYVAKRPFGEVWRFENWPEWPGRLGTGYRRLDCPICRC